MMMPLDAAPTRPPLARRAVPVLKVLTLDEAVQVAIQQNPDVRRARQEIERTRGVVIEVRAQALPLVAFPFTIPCPLPLDIFILNH
ncbi:MAG: hypothetical protein V4710_19890, partial [Verrucomicrobiota bacterium]